jgi:hypothetical protein
VIVRVHGPGPHVVVVRIGTSPNNGNHIVSGPPPPLVPPVDDVFTKALKRIGISSVPPLRIPV